MEFPLGFRFSPSDEEKISLLLYKVSGVSVPSHDFISSCDLYGEKEPWEIFGQSDESEVYFFTVLKKVGKKKVGSDYKRYSRNVGKGTWSNKGKTVPIYRKRRGGGGGGVIGYKKCLRYERKKEGGDDHDSTGTWLLKEYSLPDNLQGVKEEYKDCVLCVLKRKGQSIDNMNVLSTVTTTNVEVEPNIGDADYLQMIDLDVGDVDASQNDIGDIRDNYFFRMANSEAATYEASETPLLRVNSQTNQFNFFERASSLNIQY